MNEYLSLNEINSISKETHLSTKLDIELLVLDLLNIDKNILYRDNPSLSSKQLKKLKTLVQRREQGEPLAYILSSTGFWSLDFYVDENVLVPRPETEIIIEKVLEDFDSSKKRILDLGTGSGAIGLSLSKERKDWDIFCSDISFRALQVAVRNSKTNKVTASFINSNWLEAIADDTFDIIVSNPPYIDPDDPRIYSDGLKFEPINALISPQKGLQDIEIIINESKEALVSGGSLFIEHGYDQSHEVSLLLKKHDFTEIKKFKDLNGDDRVCSGKIFKC
tara:strand:- start:3035 stop:3868 length:834 start_codon:yes stop_codon:yes gene_type:complete